MCTLFCIPSSNMFFDCSLFYCFLQVGTLNPQNARYSVSKTNRFLKSPFRKQIETSMISGSLLAPFRYYFTLFFESSFGFSDVGYLLCISFENGVLEQSPQTTVCLVLATLFASKITYWKKLDLGRQLGFHSLVFVSC